MKNWFWKNLSLHPKFMTIKSMPPTNEFPSSFYCEIRFSLKPFTCALCRHQKVYKVSFHFNNNNFKFHDLTFQCLFFLPIQKVFDKSVVINYNSFYSVFFIIRKVKFSQSHNKYEESDLTLILLCGILNISQLVNIQSMNDILNHCLDIIKN